MVFQRVLVLVYCRSPTHFTYCRCCVEFCFSASLQHGLFKVYIEATFAETHSVICHHSERWLALKPRRSMSLMFAYFICWSVTVYRRPH